jgi:hypothetical protein
MKLVRWLALVLLGIYSPSRIAYDRKYAKQVKFWDKVFRRKR